MAVCLSFFISSSRALLEMPNNAGPTAVQGKEQRQAYFAWINEPGRVEFTDAGLVMNGLDKGTAGGVRQKINERHCGMEAPTIFVAMTYGRDAIHQLESYTTTSRR